MTKYKKLIIIVVCTIVFLALMSYVALGFLLEKPGMSGFSVMHGAAKLVLTGKDYVKVGEDRYLCMKSSVREIYDQYEVIGFLDYSRLSIDMYDSTNGTDIIKSCIVSIDGKPSKGITTGVLHNFFSGNLYSLYLAPYDGYFQPIEDEHTEMENTIKSVYFAPLD